MSSYWLKIGAGALGVFGVGMFLITLFGTARDKVEDVIDSAVTLSIPLPFDIVPFQVDGDRLGSLKRLVIHRDAPKEVSWVEVEAELADAGSWQELAHCQLTLDDFEDLDEHTSFQCNDSGMPTGYVEFGEIRFRGVDETMALWVPKEVAYEVRHADRARLKREQARIIREQVRLAELQARAAAISSAEVSATVARAMAEAFGDSIPAEVLEELRAAGIARASDGSIRVVAPEVRVEVRPAEPAAPAAEVAP